MTPETFARTPIIARRGKILSALAWLKENNPVYADVEIDYVALAGYNEDGSIPLPVQHQPCNMTVDGLSGSYTQHGVDAVELDFAGEDGASFEGSIPLSTTAALDVERAELSFEEKKLLVLEHLKHGGEFVRVAAGTEPLSTSHSPDVYLQMWPTLFPYGVGSFEDPNRPRRLGFKEHIRHLLQLSDRRFQLHLSFIFVVYNIHTRRETAYTSRLAVQKSWWPQAVDALSRVSTEAVSEVSSILSDRAQRKDFSKFEPESESQRAVMQLMKYVEWLGTDLMGSKADVQEMREEIRAIDRDVGTASIFFTLNPADNYNPVASFMAGNEVDLKAVYDGDPTDAKLISLTALRRAASLSANPVAGAAFFDKMVDTLVQDILGLGRPGRRGVFGRVSHYYGVVEAQNRGSLHLHVLVWLEGAPSPKNLQERCLSDEAYRTRVFQWLESIIKQELPEGTQGPPPATDKAAAKIARRRPILSRPLHPSSPSWNDDFAQALADILWASNQVHVHSATCYKHLPQSCHRRIHPDLDCRFNLPRDEFIKTVIDEAGEIHLRCLDGRVNGYNPIASFVFGCNTDAKHIGSGTFAQAASVYISNYIAKTSLDSSTVVAALARGLAGQLRADAADPTMVPDEDERTRRVLQRILNQMLSRREFSGQQTAAALLGHPNRYTDARFSKVYWSPILTWIDSAVFPRHLKKDFSKPSSVCICYLVGLLPFVRALLAV